MKLPFLKNRRIPRIAPPMEERLAAGSPADFALDEALTDLMHACKERDVKLFRDALMALLSNCFEESDAT